MAAWRTHSVSAGSRFPPGANCSASGVNFSTFSRTARQVELLLYETGDSPEPIEIISLDPLLAFTIAGLTASEPDVHVVLNMADAPVEVALPVISGKEWCPVVDTSDLGSCGIFSTEKQRALPARSWRAQPRSVAILESRV